MNRLPVSEKTILCADIGTSSLKAAVIASNGVLFASSRKLYSGEAPSSWSGAFFAALEELALEYPFPVSLAVISGNGPTLVPLLENGTSRAPLHWFSPDRAGVSGLSLFLPKVSAFRAEQPEIYKQTALFLSPQEWLSYTLGAEPVCALPQAGYEPYYWDKKQCAAAGIDPEKFPPFVPMGCAAGKVRDSRPPILPAGTPIAAGGPDFIMALIGTSVLEQGMICDRAGSSEGINLCISQAEYARLRILADIPVRLLPHAAQGLYNAGIIIPQSGSLFEAYRLERAAKTSALLSSDNSAYELLMEEITGDPRHPARAVLETIAGNVRAAINTFEKAGFRKKPFTVILSGGQARNRQWNRMKAELTGCVLLEPEIPDGELAGNAVLGRLYLEGSSGVFPDAQALRNSAGHIVRIRERYEPGKC